MTIKSYTKSELDLKNDLAKSESLLIKLHQIVCQAPDLTGSELEQTNIVVKELNQVVCSCYTELTSYLVEGEML